MPFDGSTLVFFDSSSLFLAANTPTGGSAFLISICSRGYLQAVVSPDVLLEAERNIVAKGHPDTFHRYRELVASTPFLVVSPPPEHVVRQHEAAFVEDAHVIAAALGSRSMYLITVDQRFERRVRASNLSITALSPAEFLRTVLPDHLDYVAIRS
jgi:predicted nucleic acid-binding protein